MIHRRRVKCVCVLYVLILASGHRSGYSCDKSLRGGNSTYMNEYNTLSQSCIGRPISVTRFLNISGSFYIRMHMFLTVT